MWAPSLCLRASLGTPSAGAPPGSLSPARMKGQTQTALWSCQTPYAPRAHRAPHPGDRAVSETPGTKTARDRSKKPPAQTPDQGLRGGRKGHASGWASKVRKGQEDTEAGSGQEGTPWSPAFKQRKRMPCHPESIPFLLCVVPTSANQPEDWCCLLPACPPLCGGMGIAYTNLQTQGGQPKRKRSWGPCHGTWRGLTCPRPPRPLPVAPWPRGSHVWDGGEGSILEQRTHFVFHSSPQIMGFYN